MRTVLKVDYDAALDIHERGKYRGVDPEDGWPRPHIEIGDYIVVNQPRKLRAWTLPPSAHAGKLAMYMQLVKGQVIGPILEVEHSYMFVTVKVMHPVEGDDTWINVWTRENIEGVAKGIRFCAICSAHRFEQMKLQPYLSPLGTHRFNSFVAKYSNCSTIDPTSRKPTTVRRTSLPARRSRQ